MTPVTDGISDPAARTLPSWFRQRLPDMEKIRGMKERLRLLGLHTVCESALCPNMGKCWGDGTATFMILGEICTRACRFCAVRAGRPQAVDKDEPYRVATAVKELNLRYAVVTSVARDDLDDKGAGQFARAVYVIREFNPGTAIEVLIPDFSNDPESLNQVAAARPEVIGHNMETVLRLSPDVRPQADYGRSLRVLEHFKRLDPSLLTKSGLMVGLGETADEVIETMRDLVRAGCDILTIGQYLAPTRRKRHVKVRRFVAPEEFEFYKKKGLELGFKYVMSAPLARSSFIAEQGYRECLATS